MLTRRNHESLGARQGVYGGVIGQTAWKVVPCQQDQLGSVHPLPAPLGETPLTHPGSMEGRAKLLQETILGVPHHQP